MSGALRTWLLSYGLAVLVFAVVDAVWIATVVSAVYQSQLGHLLAARPNAIAAVVFYLGYVAGLVHFGVQPQRSGLSMGARVTGAALYGLFTYGTWALTALALLEGVPVLVAITDIAWGVVVCSLVTLVTVRSLRGRLGWSGSSKAQREVAG